MSGQSTIVTSGITSTAGAAVLPFTGGHPMIAYLAVTTIACGAVVIFSKIVAFAVTR